MISLGTFVDIATSVMIVLGSGFALIGSWGLVRLPTLMERLHGPTKATTLGLGGMLVGSVLFFQIDQGRWSAHELLISLFLFITAPIAANMIAKVHIHRLRSREPDETESPAGTPPVPRDSNWATVEAPRKGTAVTRSEM